MEKEFTTDGKIAANNRDEVGTNFLVVVKKESTERESPHDCLSHGAETAVCNVAKAMHINLHDDSVIKLEKTSLSIKLDTKMKKELKTETEITRELVGYFHDGGEYVDRKPLHEVKRETNCEEMNSDTRIAHLSKTLVIPEDHGPIIHEAHKKPVLKTQSKIYFNTSSIKLPYVSVTLEDLFPSHVRRLGKAHSNTGSCLCIYCKGEYRYSNSEQFSSNLKEEKPLTPVRQSNRNLGNGADQQGSDSNFHREVKSNKVFRCEKCPIKFEDRKALSNHSKGHKGRTMYNYTCKFCSEKFVLMSSMLSHYKIHNVDKPFKCDQCPVKFWYESFLKAHRRVHTKEKPFECKQCLAKFQQNSSLKVHLRTHDAKKPFRCAQCPASFKFSSNLNVHLRVHSGERPFECKQCPAKFVTSSALKNHLRVHSGEKPFKCKFCPARFAQNSSLKPHLRSHTGEKPYKCELCPLRFTRSTSLSIHFKCAHSDERPFECKLCHATFKQKGSLTDHLVVHSSDRPFQCELCPSKYKSRSTLRKHSVVHNIGKPFKCEHCPAKFKYKKVLKSHLRVHSDEKPYKCKHCPAKFKWWCSLRVHSRSHIGHTPFSCAHCPVKFKRKNGLVIHIKTCLEANP